MGNFIYYQLKLNYTEKKKIKKKRPGIAQSLNTRGFEAHSLGQVQ